MYAVSDEFKEAIKRPHVAVARVEVLNSSFIIQSVLEGVINANVGIDEEDAARRSCTASVIDHNKTLTPKTAADLLHPLSGNMFRMFRGVKLPNGTSEYVAQGIFDIEDVDIQDPGEHVRLDFRGIDFSARVSANPFEVPYLVPPGTRYDLAIQDLISSRVAGLSYNFDTVTYVTPQLIFDIDDDPWARAREMAKSIGHDLWFDIQGFCRLTPIPTVDNSTPVWTYEEGEFAQLLYVNKRFRKEGVHNAVYTRSTNTSLETPIVGFAEVTDTNSPYHKTKLGGVRATTLSSEYIATQAQADQLAKARLAQVASTPVGMNIIATVNPAHEAGDVIRVKRARIGEDSLYVMKSFNINLDVWQGMNISMREVRV